MRSSAALLEYISAIVSANIDWQIMSLTDAPANKTTVEIRCATMKLQIALFVADKSAACMCPAATGTIAANHAMGRATPD